jgi:predicted nuclease of predicted toxin-antitoxin system
MRFLLDENISKTVTQHLRDADFDVVHVLAIGLQGKPDEEIMVVAIKEKRIILTHDKDFGNLLRFSLQHHHGVIMMRLHSQTPQNVVVHLSEFLSRNKTLQLKSRLVILREGGWRII